MGDEEKVNKSELTRLEALLKKNKQDVRTLSDLAELHLRMDVKYKALQAINDACSAFLLSPVVQQDGIRLVEIGLNLWKSDKYTNKTQDSVRINISLDRSKLLMDTIHLLDTCQKMVPKPAQGVPMTGTEQVLALKMAYLRECCGQYQESLVILSDLISAQAMETGFDLTYVILRAAIVLVS
jgi:hypothetical protein